MRFNVHKFSSSSKMYNAGRIQYRGRSTGLYLNFGRRLFIWSF